MNLSRAEKNKNLYEQLLADPEADIQTNDLQKIANHLNKIDANNFSKMSIVNASNNPLHSNETVKPAYFEDIKTEETPILTRKEQNIPKFNNEYLDDLVNEVKQYNISKGTRTDDDTQTALFNKIINKQNLELPKEEIVSPSVEKNEEEKNTFEDKEELRVQIKELLEETRQEEIDNEKVDNQTALEMTQELLDQTNSIKVQMSDYDSKLIDVDDKMDKVNRTLNFVLVTLFLALIILLVVIIFYVLKQKGIF